MSSMPLCMKKQKIEKIQSFSILSPGKVLRQGNITNCKRSDLEKTRGADPQLEKKQSAGVPAYDYFEYALTISETDSAEKLNPVPTVESLTAIPSTCAKISYAHDAVAHSDLEPAGET